MIDADPSDVYNPITNLLLYEIFLYLPFSFHRVILSLIKKSADYFPEGNLWETIEN